MVAVVGLCAVVVTVLSSSAGAEGQGRMPVSRDTALATTTSTHVTLWQRECNPEVTSRKDMDDDFPERFASAVQDSVDMVNNALDIVKWPLNLALSWHGAALSQIGAFITWFNFLASFVTPGGTGAALLGWLRGDPGKMSPRTWTDRRLSKFKSQDGILKRYIKPSESHVLN